jgi:indolepyruvate ferredoxin oxidoreductase
VARLYSDGSFKQQLGRQFESYDKLEYHMAPPVLGRKDSQRPPGQNLFRCENEGAVSSILAALKVSARNAS